MQLEWQNSFTTAEYTAKNNDFLLIRKHSSNTYIHIIRDNKYYGIELVEVKAKAAATRG